MITPAATPSLTTISPIHEQIHFLPFTVHVSRLEAQRPLTKLNTRKAAGPDKLEPNLNWLPILFLSLFHVFLTLHLAVTKPLRAGGHFLFPPCYKGGGTQ